MSSTPLDFGVSGSLYPSDHAQVAGRSAAVPATADDPVIGIATDRATAQWGSWKQPAVLLPATYVDAIAHVGGAPTLLPPGPWSAEALLRRVDGLLLVGGRDVQSRLYGEEPGPHNDQGNPGRDDWELRLLDEAYRSGMPILAICRGMQILNVSRGGTLHQHLPDIVGNHCHLVAPGEFSAQSVTIDPTSKLRHLLGERVVGNCHHHQAVANVGEGLRVAGRSEDGVVEALEGGDDHFIVGVQWHPETSEDRFIFETFIHASREASRVR